MTTKEQKMVEEMVENNILEAINSLLFDLAHGVPTHSISPTPYNKLNDKIRKIVGNYRPQIVQTYLRAYKSETILNEDEKLASECFTGAINYATAIFINRLMLGGAMPLTKNASKIMEALSALSKLI